VKNTYEQLDTVTRAAAVTLLSSPTYLERVTRIELSLSAWEAERLRLLGALTSQVSWPPVAVAAPWVPPVNGPLMARGSCADPM
jgi:hypothetical protein